MFTIRQTKVQTNALNTTFSKNYDKKFSILYFRIVSSRKNRKKQAVFVHFDKGRENLPHFFSRRRKNGVKNTKKSVGFSAN